MAQAVARRSRAACSSARPLARSISVAAARCGTWLITATTWSWRSGGSAITSAPSSATTAATSAKVSSLVDAVGVSTLAAGHKTLVPAIIDELKRQGADDIVVFVGGVIPQQDYDFLYAAGVKGIYGPGTPIPASAKDVLEQIKRAVQS